MLRIALSAVVPTKLRRRCGLVLLGPLLIGDVWLIHFYLLNHVFKVFLVPVVFIRRLIDETMQGGKNLFDFLDEVERSTSEGGLMQRQDLQKPLDKSLHSLDVEVGLQ